MPNINTRIKQKYATLAEWQSSTLALLPGEIAFATVTTLQEDPNTGVVTEVPTVLMKVGDAQQHKFSELEWVSARAADVYGWAKTKNVENVKVKVITKPAVSGSAAVTEEQELGTWLQTLVANCKDIDEQISGITDASTGIIDTRITAAIESLDGINKGSGSFVKSVTQANGVVTVTNGNISASDIPTLAATKISVTAAAGESAAPADLQARIDGMLANIADNAEGIQGLRDAVSGGTHFRGSVKSPDLSQSSNKKVSSIVIDDGSTSGKAITVADGDIVIQGEKEYIWSGSSTGWLELGDLTRVGTLETLTSGLITSKVNNKFVTHVTKDSTTGKLVVNTAQPTTENILHGSDSLSEVVTDLVDKMAGIDETVVDHVADELAALKATKTSATGNTTTFIDTVSLSNGNINYTTKTVPTAAASTFGLVKLTSDSNTAASKESVDALAAAQTGRVSILEETVQTIQENFIECRNNKLYLNSVEIVLDCGGVGE